MYLAFKVNNKTEAFKSFLFFRIIRKQSKLPSEIPNIKNVNYVSVDFNRQTLKKQLINAGFDQNKSTVFTLEGVSQYVSKKALNSTLEEVAELSKTTKAIFHLSYVDSLLKTNAKACFGKGYPNPEKESKNNNEFSRKSWRTMDLFLFS